MRILNKVAMNLFGYRPKYNAIIKPGTIIGTEGVIDKIRRIKECIEIGENSIINGHLLTFGNGGKIKIGQDCYVGVRTEIWSMDRIEIGNRVMISHNVNIIDSTSHSKNHEERHKHFTQIRTIGHPRNWGDLPGVFSGPIVIDDDVWISFNVTILKNVHIGSGSIIAAGSIVTRDVPPHSLYRNEISPVIIPLE